MTHFIADDGAKIHVNISGEGPPIVMLHGWTSSHQEWQPFIETLNKRHRVYRWDARAHGGHTYPKETAPTAERMARDLKNLFEHYQLENITAVGHSMGALTLWQYLRDHGDAHLAKLCLIDQSPKLITDANWTHGIYGEFDNNKSRELIAWLHEDFAEGVLKLTAFGLNQRAKEKYLAGSRGWMRIRNHLRTLEASSLIDCWNSLTAADYRDVLERIDLPTLLIYGGLSNFYREETAHYVAARIPRAILHIYENSDHSPHQWQKERFSKELMAFIDQAV